MKTWLLNGCSNTKELTSMARMAWAEDFTFVLAVLGGTGAKGSASMVGAAKARAKKTA